MFHFEDEPKVVIDRIKGFDIPGDTIVSVYMNEKFKEPHFHISNDTEYFYSSIYMGDKIYFSHRGKNNYLTEKQSLVLDNFLKDKNINNSSITNWDAICYTWNMFNNIKRDTLSMNKPDYKNLIPDPHYTKKMKGWVFMHGPEDDEETIAWDMNFPGVGSGTKILTCSFEDKVPHIHIINHNKKFEACIRTNKPEYHNCIGHKYPLRKLNMNQLQALNDYFYEHDKNDEYYINWRRLRQAWKNSKFTLPYFVGVRRDPINFKFLEMELNN